MAMHNPKSQKNAANILERINPLVWSCREKRS